MACELNHYQATLELIRRHVDVNTPENSGLTALFYAVRDGRVNTVRLLASNGARLDRSLRHNLECIWLAIAGQFMDRSVAETKLAFEIMEVLRSIDLDFVVHGYTMLHVAAMYGHIHLTKFLVRERASIEAKAPGLGGQTALHIAANEGHLAIVHYLLDCGATVDSVDAFGRTPMHLASSASSLRMLCDLPPSPCQHLRCSCDVWGRLLGQSMLARGATDASDGLLDPEMTESSEWTWEEWICEVLSQAWYVDTDGTGAPSSPTLLLPFNISSKMTGVLLRTNIAVSVSIHAKRP